MQHLFPVLVQATGNPLIGAVPLQVKRMSKSLAILVVFVLFLLGNPHDAFSESLVDRVEPYTVKDGDTLFDISSRLFTDDERSRGAHWLAIFAHNVDRGSIKKTKTPIVLGPSGLSVHIEPGQKLEIPHYIGAFPSAASITSRFGVRSTDGSIIADFLLEPLYEEGPPAPAPEAPPSPAPEVPSAPVPEAPSAPVPDVPPALVPEAPEILEAMSLDALAESISGSLAEPDAPIVPELPAAASPPDEPPAAVLEIAPIVMIIEHGTVPAPFPIEGAEASDLREPAQPEPVAAPSPGVASADFTLPEASGPQEHDAKPGSRDRIATSTSVRKPFISGIGAGVDIGLMSFADQPGFHISQGVRAYFIESVQALGVFAGADIMYQTASANSHEQSDLYLNVKCGVDFFPFVALLPVPALKHLALYGSLNLGAGYTSDLLASGEENGNAGFLASPVFGLTYPLGPVEADLGFGYQAIWNARALKGIVFFTLGARYLFSKETK